jgi:hypothetical protein
MNDQKQLGKTGHDTIMVTHIKRNINRSELSPFNYLFLK